MEIQFAGIHHFDIKGRQRLEKYLKVCREHYSSAPAFIAVAYGEKEYEEILLRRDEFAEKLEKRYWLEGDLLETYINHIGYEVECSRETFSQSTLVWLHEDKEPGKMAGGFYFNIARHLLDHIWNDRLTLETISDYEWSKPDYDRKDLDWSLVFSYYEAQRLLEYLERKNLKPESEQWGIAILDPQAWTMGHPYFEKMTNVIGAMKTLGYDCLLQVLNADME